MDQLEGEILQYESQLSQVQLAIAALSEGPEKKNLSALEADLKELIALSKNSLTELVKEDSLSEQYDLFKAELDQLDTKSNENVVVNTPETSGCASKFTNDLKSELNNLKGTKCRAPFMYKWTDNVTYHNAFICHVPELDKINEHSEITVKVMFTNPTHIEMLPCPYYLEGECKFNDNKCRYSHGESVVLSSLKEYREPEFSKLSSGFKVFAKQNDGLWHRAHVISIDDINCYIKFESNSKEESVPLHNILPLDYSDQEESSDSDNDWDTSTHVHKEEIVKRILNNPPGSTLGEWEKFTKGFGSRIMAKMGYIHGSGLGKDASGRVDPIPAVVLPAGKSLDHCMMLKEKAGNQDLFKAEKKLKYLQKKHEEKLKKAYENEKETQDIFTFLNSKLDLSKSQQVPKIEVKQKLKNESSKNLNIIVLQLAEEMRKVEKEIKCLNQSLARQAPHSPSFNAIKERLAAKENKLMELHASEKKVRTEQDMRKERQKLVVF